MFIAKSAFITLMLCVLLCFKISVVFCNARLSTAEQVASLVTLQQYCTLSGEESIGKKYSGRSRHFGYTVTLVLKKKNHEMQVIMDHLQSTNLKSLVVGTCMFLYLPHFCLSPQDFH